MRYALVNRPPEIGAIPRGIEYTVERRPAPGQPHHAMARHGILVCRQLTDEECLSYELAPLVDDVGPLATAIAEDLSGYAAEYLSQSTEEPEEFRRAVLQRAERQAVRPSVGDPAALVAAVVDRLAQRQRSEQRPFAG